MLNIIGQQLTSLTAYNEYITDVIIATIVYLSAFSLVIRAMLSRKKKVPPKLGYEPAPKTEEAKTEAAAEEKGGEDA
jgi:simple sugar transport system permease protein